MLALRVPVSFLGLVASYAGLRNFYVRLLDSGGPLWTRLLATLPDAVDPQALREALARFPPPPTVGSALPWLALLAPLAVLSLWLHDAAFDHAGLWLLGGLRARQGFRASLVADAEALQVGVLGAAAGLLGDLPWPGPQVSTGVALALIPVAVYFWLIRGHALAAWHSCPVWKGVTATILNLVLAVAMVLLLLAACAVMVLLLV